MRAIFEKFDEIRPRTIYLVMALALVIPIVRPIGMPIPIERAARSMFEWIESCEPGEIVFFDSAMSTGSIAELRPILEAWFYQCLKNDLKVINVSQTDFGAQSGADICKGVAAQAAADGYNAEYGVDWVFVGFKSMVWRELREDFWLTCGNTDYFGNDFATLPLMNRVKKWDLQTSKGLLCFVGGTPGVGTYMIEWADHDIYVACTAGMETSHQAILQSGQLKGLVAGLKDGSQYEQLVGRLGVATALMDAQSMGHVLIVVLMVLGNVSFFLKMKARR